MSELLEKCEGYTPQKESWCEKKCHWAFLSPLFLAPSSLLELEMIEGVTTFVLSNKEWGDSQYLHFT